uniref:Uncharacterized protein n=1 Tax=Oryza rufipogon TaxID=4529 RepID=A0A0E0NTZ6_ORYRU
MAVVELLPLRHCLRAVAADMLPLPEVDLKPPLSIRATNVISPPATRQPGEGDVRGPREVRMSSALSGSPPDPPRSPAERELSPSQICLELQSGGRIGARRRLGVASTGARRRLGVVATGARAQLGVAAIRCEGGEAAAPQPRRMDLASPSLLCPVPSPLGPLRPAPWLRLPVGKGGEEREGGDEE